MNVQKWYHLFLNKLTKFHVHPMALLVLAVLIAGSKFLFLITQYAEADHSCSDPVSITGATSWTVNECHGDVTITNGATLTISGGVTADLSSLTLGDGVTNGFIVAQANTTTGDGVIINIDGSVDVKSGSNIRGDNSGYLSGQGPGAGGSNGGGGHGGMGGNTNGGGTYGDATQPVTSGSGGNGNRGGSAIKIEIGGNLTNNGSIRSDGNSSANNSGGAGGSVWIAFVGGSSTWTGTGFIRARGGNGTDNIRGGGGGGRVAVTGYVTDTHSGTTDAFGGTSDPVEGAAGTVFLKSSAQSVGTLIVDNNNVVTEVNKVTRTGVSSFTPNILTIQNAGRYNIASGESLTVPSGGSLTVSANSALINSGSVTLPSSSYSLSYNLVQWGGSLGPAPVTLTIASGGTLTADGINGTNTINTITVQSGGNINHSDNSTTETYKMDLSVTNLTVNASGTINVNSLGYDVAQGPGSVAAGSSVGGTYGGMGGVAASSTNTYGATKAPNNIGSGGDSGQGGGAVKISVAGNLVNNGTISANGVNTGGGGGSGGSVWIDFTGGSSTWTGSGSITTDGGGTTGTAGGGGGGGRVAVTGYTTTIPANPTALGAQSTNSASYGAAGTVFTKSSSETQGTLRIFNNAIVPTTNKRIRINDSSLTINTLTFLNNAGTNFEIPSGAGMTVTSGTTTFGSNVNFLNRGTYTSTGTTDSISGVFTADGTQTMGTVTINSGGTLTHSDNSTAETFKITISATAFTLASGGIINLNGLGYDGGASQSQNGNGPGLGLGSVTQAGGGGGYGGAGGKGGTATGANGGGTYGTSTNPVNIGSGGGGGNTVSSTGGNAGGAIILNVTNNVSLSANITTNGTNGANLSNGGGGGSGGTISITAGGNLTCSSNSLQARGGNGQGTINVGGGGGGGRIYLQISGTASSGCGSATGGTGNIAGGTGTVVQAVNAPTMNAASNVTTTSIQWNWTDQSVNETLFRLRDGSNNVIQTVVSTSTATTGTAYSHNETLLSVNTQYTRHVIATDGTLDSAPSSSAITYTLANTPGTPTLSSVAATTITVTIAVNSNPAATEFAIFESTTNQYVQSNGSLGSSPAWQNNTTWGGASGKQVTGLTSNTQYTFAVKARNGDNVETALSSSASAQTLATVPDAPTLSSVTATDMTVTFTATSNPANTEYAIFESTTSQYVQANGTFGGTTVWQTHTTWGGGSGQAVTGLSPNTQYTFAVKARNASSVESSLSSTTSTYTLANIPAAPVLEDVGTASLQLTIAVNGNPAGTQFAIFESTTSKFVQVDGSLNTTTVWQPISSWGSEITIAPLSEGTSYTFAVKARNNNNVETALSPTASATTLTNSIAAPIMITPTNITESSVTWRWLDTTTNETSFRLVNSGAGTQIAIIPSTTVSTSGTEYSYTDTGISPNTRPVRKVHALSNGTESPGSEEIGVYTLAAKPGTPRIVDVRNTSVVLIIGEGGNSDGTEFAIFETTTKTYIAASGRIGSSDPAWKKFRGITNGWGGQNGFRIFSLDANTGYTFVVKARNSNLIETDFSDSVSATTYQAPDRPRWLDPTDVTSNAITWNWEDRSISETSFHLTNSSNSVFYTIASTTKESEQTRYSYREGNLAPNTEYVRRLTAFDGNNDGPFTTNRRYTLANVPGKPSVSDITDTTAAITIAPNQNPDYTAYAIYNVDHLSYVRPKSIKRTDDPKKRRLIGILGRSCRGRIIINSQPRDLCVEFWRTKADPKIGWEKDGPGKLELNGLKPNTTYRFATRAKNRIGEKTGFSEEVSFTTGAAQTPSQPAPLIRLPFIPRLPSCVILCGSNLAVQFNPPPGTYTGPIEIEITYSPKSHPAEIRFTKDKSEPRLVYSPRYVNKVLLTESGIIKARAFGSESDIIEASYTINPEEDPEQIDITVQAEPKGGEYNQPVTVTLTPSVPATILYTTDGSDPKNSDQIYTGPITLTSSAALMFVAQDEDGNFGPIGSEQYNITTEPDFALITWPEFPASDLPEGVNKEDVVYELRCGEEVVSTTSEPTFTDTTERPNGCDYTVLVKTKDGKEIGAITDVTVTSKPAVIPYTGPTLLERAALLAPFLTIGLGVAAGVMALILGGTPSLPWINVLSWRRKRQAWGRVINAATREPAAGARVLLFDTAAYNRLVDQTISDRQGRYGFVVKPGQYKIQVTQPGLVFPSALDVTGYHGQPFSLTNSSIINTDIPVDPAIPRHTVWQSIRRFGRRFSFLQIPFLVAGSAFSILNILVVVSALNALFVAYYLVMVIFEIRNRRLARRLAPILDENGNLVPYAILRLIDINGKVVISKAANDEGRLYLLVPAGTYQAEIITPASGSTPARRSHHTITLSHGALNSPLRTNRLSLS